MEKRPSLEFLISDETTALLNVLELSYLTQKQSCVSFLFFLTPLQRADSLYAVHCKLAQWETDGFQRKAQGRNSTLLFNGGGGS